MKSIVLASGSPRRKELLEKLVPEFQVLIDESPEEKIQGELPQETVKRLALQKAENVLKRVSSPSIIIAADTVVAIDNKILGKPKDKKEAFDMLKTLSGRQHQVFTGIALIDGENVVSSYEATKVKFKDLTDDEIYAYIDTKEPMDKAGAYGIQDIGALLIEGIEGDYFNVVGLPLCRLGRILKENFNVDLLKNNNR